MSLEENLWLNLPSDILYIILSRIPLFYHPAFASVCKNWNAICTHKLYPVGQTDPLLIHVKNWESGFIHYYSPFWNKTFKVKSPIALQESRFFSSKDGWLVLYQKGLEEEEVQVVLINPATNISYSYPGLLYDRFFTGITFSGSPGKENFVLFGITSQEHEDGLVRICLWREGEWKLSSAIFVNQSPFFMSPYSSPVEFKDCFCCVSESGTLGVFMLENVDWIILPGTKKFSTPIFNKELYLIESKDKIRLVVGGNHNPLVSQVFYLDRKKMIWRKIENLNSCSMFIGPKASIMVDFNKKEEDRLVMENSKDDEEVDVVKKIDRRKKPKEIKEEVDKKAKTVQKIGYYKGKVDINGNLMNNRVYSTGIYGNVEAVEAQMEISDGELFFVTKAADQTRSKNVPREANIFSYSLENHKITGKYHGLSHPLHCAWYQPEISCSSQDQKIKK